MVAGRRAPRAAGLAAPADARPPARARRSATTDDGGCGTDIPLVGDVGRRGVRRRRLARRPRRRSASTPGLDFLDAVTDVASDALDELRGAARTTRSRDARAARRARRAQLARTPAGMLALDVVEIGRRFADTVTADCSDDAPPADGTGGSAHRVMVVAGINSSGPAGDRGPTVALDVDALGYHRGEGEVRYYSYAADGGPYTADDTHGPIDGRGAPARASNSAPCSASSPDARSTSSRTRRAASSSTCSSPHVLRRRRPHASRRSAPWSRSRRRTRVRRSPPPAQQIRALDRSASAALDAVEQPCRSLPPPSSPAVQRAVGGLAARSATCRRAACPNTSTSPRSAPPRTSSSPPPTSRCRGATETTVAVERARASTSAIVQDPNALRAVRAALEGRAPPCVGFVTALRGAIAPVVISRASHTFGDMAGAAIVGGTP